MSLWVQFNYRRVAQSDLPPYWFLLGPSLPACESRARASTALVSRFTSSRIKKAVKGVRKLNKNRQIACLFPGVQIVERRRKIHEEKKNEGRQLNSLPVNSRALLSERLDGTGYVGEP